MSTHGTMRQSTALQIDRRRALRTSGMLAGAATLLSGSHAARASQSGGETLELDVAMDGRTWHMNQISDTGPPLMGDTFVVLGSIFPADSFDSGVVGPDSSGAIGRWICQGTFIVDVASGNIPLMLTTQQFILGDGLSSSEGQLEAAPDALLSVGVEGGVEQNSRTLSGGYGAHAGANGSVLQTTHGTNETLMHVAPGETMPAFNYRFAFSFTS